MDELTFSIGDILASVLRRGKQVICCAIVFAVLLGGFKGYTVWKNSNEEDYIDLDAVSYEQEKQRLERVIEQTRNSIRSQEDYIANSLWMNMNPYDKHATEIHLMITDVDEKDLGITFVNETSPRDYLLNSIANQYAIIWGAEDLSVALKLPKYEAVPNKYIREIVWAEILEGGVIQITALGHTDAESSELAKAAAKLLLEKEADVVKSSFKHSISLYNTAVHKNQIDSLMAEAQHANYLQIDTYNNTILEAEKELKGLSAPDSLLITVIKMLLVGGILGGILACGWYAGKMLLLGSVQSSSQVEKAAAIPFAGILMNGKGIFRRLANWAAGERTWKDETQALDYIARLAKLRLPGERLLLTSTLGLDEHESAVENVRNALAAAGIQVSFESDFFYNAGAFSALRDCDGVLLLEQVDGSKLEQIRKICSFSQKQEKTVVGFVLV